MEAIDAFEELNVNLRTRLILSIDRRHDISTATSILDIAKRHKGKVVGIDLCGDPTKRPNGEVSIFTSHFIEVKKAGLYITVHFAEAKASGSRAELDELLSWQPDRLGHVIWEDDDVKKEIARRGLCLELCLSCNVKAEMVSGGFEGHHFGAWRGVEGVKISLSVSNPLEMNVRVLTLCRLMMLASLRVLYQTNIVS